MYNRGTQKRGKKSESNKSKTASNNNGQLCIATPNQVVHAKPPGPPAVPGVFFSRFWVPLLYIPLVYILYKLVVPILYKPEVTILYKPVVHILNKPLVPILYKLMVPILYL